MLKAFYHCHCSLQCTIVFFLQQNLLYLPDAARYCWNEGSVSWGENYAGSSGLASPKFFSPMHFMEDIESTAQAVRTTTTITAATLHPFNGLFSRTTWVSQYQKGKTSLDLNEATDNGVLGCSGIRWTICKQSAPRCRQITASTPHHSIFTRWMLFLMPNRVKALKALSTEGYM